LNGDESDDGRNHDHQIPLVPQKRPKGVEAALYVQRVVVVDDAVGDADARRASEVDVGIDRQTFIAVEKGGIVRWIDYDREKRERSNSSERSQSRD